MLAAEMKAQEAERRMSLQEMADDNNTPGKARKPRADSNGSGGKSAKNGSGSKSGKSSSKAAAAVTSAPAGIFSALAAAATPATPIVQHTFGVETCAHYERVIKEADTLYKELFSSDKAAEE